MNKFDTTTIEGNNNYYLIDEEKQINEVLPIELLEKILSFLTYENAQSAIIVNHFWRVVTLDAIKHKELHVIKVFTDFLRTDLPKENYETQKVKLLNIFKETNFFCSKNLNEIKSSIYRLKEYVINILKDIEEIDLDNLENSSRDILKPESFEKIFNLARIYRKLDIAHKITIEDKRDDALGDIAVELVKIDLEKAIEAAHAISDEYIKNHVFSDLCMTLAENGDVNGCLRVAHSLPECVTQKHLFKEIISTLMERGHYEDVVSLTNAMPSDDQDTISNLQEISNELARKGYLEKAKEVANKITNQFMKMQILNRINQRQVL